MAEQDVLDQAERASTEFRRKQLVKERLRHWWEEALTACAIVTAIGAMIVFGFR